MSASISYKPQLQKDSSHVCGSVNNPKQSLETWFLHFLGPPRYLRMADAKLDGWLNKVEEAVLSHQTARLQRWAERQRQALQRAVKVEQAVCANNSSITDGVITGGGSNVFSMKYSFSPPWFFASKLEKQYTLYSYSWLLKSCLKIGNHRK